MNTNAAATQDLLPHDIPAPLPYLEYPFWMVVTAGGAAIILLALLAWVVARWLRGRRPRDLSAKEKALTALARARSESGQAAPYLFSIEVCDVLRNFLGAEHHLPATTQTSYEFLQTARQSSVFDQGRLEHLTRFLGKADAIKFARASATGADNVELVGLAENLVKGGENAVAS